MTDKRKNFFIEYSKHQNTIYGYIASIVPVLSDVDDIFQETSIELWEKFELYEPGTNFLAWARSFAHFNVLRYRQKKGRDRLQFNDEIAELLEESFEEEMNILEEREKALKVCLEKFGDEEKKLFEVCYNDKMTIKKAAQVLGRKVKGLYKTMTRLRKLLMGCINKQLETA